MSRLKYINPVSKVNNDTGFGTNSDNNGGRFINKDGSFNLKKEGISFSRRFSIFQSMLDMPRWRFISVILGLYFFINFFYTLIYLLLGVEGFQGIIGNTFWQQFKELYFFSTETFTTVGYGRVNPMGTGVNLVAAVEALSGFISFAIVAGLFYGRFSKPRPHLIFSQHALISPYKDMHALMFRLASYKDKHNLNNVDIKVNISLLVQENGKAVYKFYEAELERSRVDSLIMNWTIVHPIDAHSPLLGLTEEDFKNSDLEIYVYVRGYDDVYSAIVLQRTSYTFEEIKHAVKFVPMYRESKDGKTTILELHRLNEYKEV